MPRRSSNTTSITEKRTCTNDNCVTVVCDNGTKKCTKRDENNKRTEKMNCDYEKDCRGGINIETYSETSSSLSFVAVILSIIFICGLAFFGFFLLMK